MNWALYDHWEQLNRTKGTIVQPETRDAVRDGVKTSAAVILPMVFELLGSPPRSVIDVGAGEGWWLLEAQRLGATNTLGLDLEPSILTADDKMVRVENWNAENGGSLPFGGVRSNGGGSHTGIPWELAICVEFAEHVSPRAGWHTIHELTRVSERILWGAAVPGQGGDGHVNEQWPEYWNAIFNEHGWMLHDDFRDVIWHAPGVEPWYAQNCMMASPDPFRAEKSTKTLPPNALVHPTTWAHHRGVSGPRVVV